MIDTVRLAPGRVPVMVGVSKQSLPRTLDLATMAKEAKADLILAPPPHSYAITQAEVYEYFKALAAESRLPLVVYQNDEVGVKVEPETLARLSTVPGVMGAKVYMPYNSLQKTFTQSDRPGQFVVINGDEYFFAPALLLGIRHFTMGGPGNLCPGWCTSIIQAAAAGGWSAVIARHDRMEAFCDALYGISSTAYTAVKGALEQMSICSARISSPHPERTGAGGFYR
jgi:dihydrodipicolinate synthase/N-acetylneuraminate lyase